MIHLVLLAALLAGEARAQAGLTGASTLRRPLAARPVALGDAFAGVEGGMASLSLNPAGLARLERPELKTTYMQGMVEDKFTFISFGTPTGPITLAAGLAYYDGGSIHVNLSNGTQDKRKAAQDFVGLFSAAVPLGPLSLGASVKAFRFNLGEEATAAGGALDAGVQTRTPLKGLTVGASIVNIGPDVKFESEGDPLPLSMRAGAAWTFEFSPDPTFAFNSFMLTADVFKTRDEEAAASSGLEMSMSAFEATRIALRFGYLFNRDLGSFATGVGLREGRFSLDYAMGVNRRLSNPHHLTFGIAF